MVHERRGNNPLPTLIFEIPGLMYIDEQAVHSWKGAMKSTMHHWIFKNVPTTLEGKVYLIPKHQDPFWGPCLWDIPWSELSAIYPQIRGNDIKLLAFNIVNYDDNGPTNSLPSNGCYKIFKSYLPESHRHFKSKPGTQILEIGTKICQTSPRENRWPPITKVSCDHPISRFY